MRALTVLDAWRAGTPLTELGFDQRDGRVDLRGLTLPDIPVDEIVSAGRVEVGLLATAPPRVTDARIAGVDLTGARLDRIVFDGCEFEDVVFARAHLESTAFLGCTMVGVDFDRARIGGVLSTGVVNRFRTPPVMRGSVYRDCRFTGARITDAPCDHALFERCDFTGATLRGLDVALSMLRDCALGATLADVLFNGTEGVCEGPECEVGLERADFTDARFDDVDFRAIRITEPRWPTRQRYVLLRGDVAGFFHRAAALIETIPAHERVLIDEYVTRNLDVVPGQREWIVLTDMLRRPSEHAYEVVAEQQLLELADQAAASGVDIVATVHAAS